MNYKIKVTKENQAIVKRIANENGMNPHAYKFSLFECSYIIENGIINVTYSHSNYPELTTEQFIEMFDKKLVTEWLAEIKAKNLSLIQLADYLMSSDCPTSVWNELDGCTSIEKAQILLNKWNAKPEWKPIRGERVLVWDFDENNAIERIFLVEIEGAAVPIRVVADNDEDKFLNKQFFHTIGYSYMKQLPKVEPIVELDFKAKVIELFEKRIAICKESVEEYKNENRFYAAEVWKNCKNENAEMLKQINQL